jgi:hypothetical protein
MGLLDKIIPKDNQPQKAGFSDGSIDLNKEELGVILMLIKNSHFKGEDIERIYNLTLKIQEAYIKINK